MSRRIVAMLVSALQLKISTCFFPYYRKSAVTFMQPFARRRLYGIRSFAVDSSNEGESMPEPMANIYTSWNIDDDRLLFQNRQRSIPELSALLGRGLKGVESRLSKLEDVNSDAYARLFAGSEAELEEEDDGKKKLVPAKEVLRRIQWDHSLSMSDFSVAYYDRVDNTIEECPMDLPNTSIKGNDNLFILALPEHRISSIKYKERVVWDKDNRLDRVFGSMNGNKETIQDVIANYESWEEEKRIADEWNRKRQKEVSTKMQTILGDDRFQLLKTMSSQLLEDFDDNDLTYKKYTEKYVDDTLNMFKETQKDDNPDTPVISDLDFLDILSELVALLPHSKLRPAILSEIALQIKRLSGSKRTVSSSISLPELNESDLIETFVRGSGAGGQKVNKTSNKVVLLHEPTQLRIECQETRSLQQNRKIARKRLRYKLDELLNGKQSISSQKNSKASAKKAKSKARNRARLKKKKKKEKEQ